MTTTFRKRPVDITAVQWTGRNLAAVQEFMGGTVDVVDDSGVQLRTVHGDVAYARPGDWIVPEAEPGRFYPVKPDVFAATYDEVDPDAAAPAAPSTLLVGWRMSIVGDKPTTRVEFRDWEAARANISDAPIPALASLDLLHAESLKEDLEKTLATAKTVAGLAPLVVAAGGNAQTFADELVRKAGQRGVADALSALGGVGGFGDRRGGLFG